MYALSPSFLCLPPHFRALPRRQPLASWLIRGCGVDPLQAPSSSASCPADLLLCLDPQATVGKLAHSSSVSRFRGTVTTSMSLARWRRKARRSSAVQPDGSALDSGQGSEGQGGMA